MTSNDISFDLDSIFPEPERPPTPEPTYSTYTRTTPSSSTSEPQTLRIRLVGNHPLWAHHLWNAARSFASFLDRTRLCQGRTVLELGAGGALPSIIAILTDATKVVITDYFDKPLLDNIHFNISNNVPPPLQSLANVQGYIWGRDPQPLLGALPSGSTGFGVIILSDLLFNHSEHDALLKTCEQVISNSDPTACILVFYSHHRPRFAHRDMEFFEKARQRGWQTDEIVTETFTPMFPDDTGDEVVRSTVHGWKLTRS